ncbi:hypothetical protein [Hymenobacter properus]|uniref:Secreted protein n=1 Tax=Hymenobacter properus TaxID=2791026 RepID=A0A931BHV1_9BACT|nr:hypothetical protein [Hymenobacter properus]MBF9141607.1 hypothetical protein [Hymenobacter properus]MBR7720416.1 hypothetical protein [Microvirga sp. SRT04]
MLTAADALQLVFCASTVTAAVRAGWCTTATPAVVKVAEPPLVLPVPALRAVAWA